jgi:hypothetical protein
VAGATPAVAEATATVSTAPGRLDQGRPAMAGLTLVYGGGRVSIRPGLGWATGSCAAGRSRGTGPGRVRCC